MSMSNVDVATSGHVVVNVVSRHEVKFSTFYVDKFLISELVPFVQGIFVWPDVLVHISRGPSPKLINWAQLLQSCVGTLHCTCTAWAG